MFNQPLLMHIEGLTMDFQDNFIREEVVSEFHSGSTSSTVSQITDSVPIELTIRTTKRYYSYMAQFCAYNLILLPTQPNNNAPTSLQRIKPLDCYEVETLMGLHFHVPLKFKEEGFIGLYEFVEPNLPSLLNFNGMRTRPLLISSFNNVIYNKKGTTMIDSPPFSI